MYRLVFQNSKIALIFAILTIVGAVSMVGTPEDSGVVAQAAAFAQAAGANRAGGAAKAARARPSGSSIFGEYAAADPAEASAEAEAPVEDTPLVVGPLK